MTLAVNRISFLFFLFLFIVVTTFFFYQLNALFDCTEKCKYLQIHFHRSYSGFVNSFLSFFFFQKKKKIHLKVYCTILFLFVFYFQYSIFKLLSSNQNKTWFCGIIIISSRKKKKNIIQIRAELF